MHTTWRILAVLAAVLTVRAADLRNRGGRVSKFNEDTSDVETFVSRTSEKFRAVMKTGSQEYQLPIMDPVRLSSDHSFEVGFWGLSAQVAAQNIQVSGASEFQLTKISQVAGTNRVSVEFLVPTLEISCHYDFTGQFGFVFVRSNFVEEAKLKLQMLNVRGVATMELVTRDDGALGLSSLNVDSWTYDKAVSEVQDVKDTGVVARSLNKLLNSFSFALVIQPHMAEVSAWVSDSGKQVVGRFLDGIAGRLTIADLDKKATQLLEQLRGVMRSGNEKLSLPVLDPLAFYDLKVPHINSKGIKVDLSVTDFVIPGTSDFVIKKISQLEGTNDLSVDLEVPVLRASARYDANGKLFFLSLVDDGIVYVDIKGLKVSATASLVANADNGLVLKTLKIDSWSVESVEESIYSDETWFLTGYYFSYVVNRAIPSAIETSRDQITAWAQSSATAVLNKFLAGTHPAVAPASRTVHMVPDMGKALFSQLLAEAVETAKAA